MDLVHVHHGWPLGGIAAAALAGKIPFAMTLHGSEILEGQDWLPAARRAGALAAPSGDLARRAEQALRAAGQARRVQVLPSPLGPEWFARPLPLGDPTRGVLRVAHVSNGRAVKRTALAVEACARADGPLARRGIRLELDLIGPGHDRSAAPLAHRLGIGERTRVLGCLPPGPLWTEGAGRGLDVLLLASRYESFGLVAQEALASGIEPLGPAVGGLAEAFGNEGLGTWVEASEPGLADRLASGLVALAERPRRTPEDLKQTRARLESRYGWQVTGPLWETWLEHALQQSSPCTSPAERTRERLPGPQRDLTPAP